MHAGRGRSLAAGRWDGGGGGCCPRVKDVESNCSSGGVDATKDMAVDTNNTTKVGARSQ